MYLLSIATQSKNAFHSFWANNKLRKFAIYLIVFMFVSVYISNSLNSLIRRDRIDLPPAIEEMISSIYAAENLEYQKRMKEREKMRKQMQQGGGQQSMNKGGFKTTFTPAGALVIIVEVVAASAICCFIIYLLYRRFTVDTIPPLPVLSTKGKIDEKD